MQQRPLILVATLAALIIGGCSDGGRQGPQAHAAPMNTSAPAAPAAAAQPTTSAASTKAADQATGTGKAPSAAPSASAPSAAPSAAAPSAAVKTPAGPPAEGQAKVDKKDQKKEKPEKKAKAENPKSEPKPAEPKADAPPPAPFAGDAARLGRQVKVDAPQQAALDAKAKESDAAYALFRNAHAPKLAAAQDALAEAKKSGDAARITDAQSKVDALRREDRSFVAAERGKLLAILTPEQRQEHAGQSLWQRIWRQYEAADIPKGQGDKVMRICVRVATAKSEGTDAWLKDPMLEGLRGAENDAVAAIDAEILTPEQREKAGKARAEQAAKQQKKKDAPAAPAAGAAK